MRQGRLFFHATRDLRRRFRPCSGMYSQILPWNFERLFMDVLTVRSKAIPPAEMDVNKLRLSRMKVVNYPCKRFGWCNHGHACAGSDAGLPDQAVEHREADQRGSIRGRR